MPDTLRFPRDLLRLLYWLYFKPLTLRAYVRRIDPELNENLDLWGLSEQQRTDPRVRHLIWLSLALFICVPLVAVPATGAVIDLLAVSGIPVSTFDWQVSMRVTLVWIIGGLFFLIRWRRLNLLVWSGAIILILLIISLFLPDYIRNLLVETLRNAIAQLLGDPDAYLAFWLLAFWLLAGGAADSLAFGVAGGVAFGIAFGVAFGVAGGVAFGVAFGAALGVAFSAADNVARRVVAGGVAGGVALGVAGGVALGVTGGVALGVAGGVVFGVALTVTLLLFYFRLPFYLIELPWNLIVGRWAESAPPEKAARRFRLIPLYWDEVIWLPLWGLDHTLVEIGKKDRRLAQALIADVAQSFRQGWAARNALIELTIDDLEQAQDVRAIAGIAEHLTWLPSTMPAELETVLLPIREIARYVQAALESDTFYNKQRQLRDAYERTRRVREGLALNKDRRIAVQFGRILERWEAILARQLME